jgi:hypothetical protein
MDVLSRHICANIVACPLLEPSRVWYGVNWVGSVGMKGTISEEGIVGGARKLSLSRQFSGGL